MRSLRTAYLLTLPALAGLSGFHRLYQGKIGTGILWLLTWGLGGIGTIYDLVTMAKQLRDSDERDTGERREVHDYWVDLAESMPSNRDRERLGRQDNRTESLEHFVLRLAGSNGGWTSAAQLALKADISADRAKAELDTLVSKGLADIRVHKRGIVAYVFPDLLSEDQRGEFEGS